MSQCAKENLAFSKPLALEEALAALILL